MKQKTENHDELGALIDAHWKLYQSRKKAEAVLKEIKEKEDKSEESLLRHFADAKLEGARGRKAQLSVGRREFVEILEGDGFLKLCRFVKTNNAFDLLYRQVSVKALRDRQAAGQRVPGVKLGAKKVLHITTL